MAKKRDKRYQGDDAKRERPVVKKVSVSDKSKLRRWYDDNKNEVKIRGVQAALASIVVLIIWGVASFIF